MRGAWVVAVLALAGLAGCVDDEPTVDPVMEPQEILTQFQLLIVDERFRPVEGADVTMTLVDPHATTKAGRGAAWSNVSDADGLVTFPALPLGGYEGSVRFTEERTLRFDATLTSEGPDGPVELSLPPPPVPPPETVHYAGFIECGAEYLIISGSCDHLVKEFNDNEGVFADERVFDVPVRADWGTVTIDVSFGALGPGVDGLRLGAYGPTSDDQLTDYERFHAAHGSEPFTLRLEPGTDYGDIIPTPEGGTTFRFQMFPHGHGWREGCDVYGPVAEQCFLGLGLSARMDFELAVTVHYQEPAPEGWTLLA